MATHDLSTGAQPEVLRLRAEGRRWGELAVKVALFTGGARGIGRATALKLAAAGADVVVNYYNSHEDAEALAGEVRAIGRQAATIQSSVGDPDSVDELFAAFEYASA